MKSIVSRENSTYRLLKEWATSAKARKRDQVTLLEGRRLILGVAQSGGRARFLVTAESSQQVAVGDSPLGMIDADQHVVLADSLFDNLSDVKTSQGVLAVTSIPIPAPWPTGGETVVLLEDIQDPGNLGSIIRSAAGAGVGYIGLSAGCASAWSPKVVRAGMGGHFHLAIHEGMDLPAVIGALSIPVVATAPEAEESLYQAELEIGRAHV